MEGPSEDDSDEVALPHHGSDVLRREARARLRARAAEAGEGEADEAAEAAGVGHPALVDEPCVCGLLGGWSVFSALKAEARERAQNAGSGGWRRHKGGGLGRGGRRRVGLRAQQRMITCHASSRCFHSRLRNSCGGKKKAINHRRYVHSCCGDNKHTRHSPMWRVLRLETGVSFCGTPWVFPAPLPAQTASLRSTCTETVC